MKVKLIEMEGEVRAAKRKELQGAKVKELIAKKEVKDKEVAVEREEKKKERAARRDLEEKAETLAAEKERTICNLQSELQRLRKDLEEEKQWNYRQPRTPSPCGSFRGLTAGHSGTKKIIFGFGLHLT